MPRKHDYPDDQSYSNLCNRPECRIRYCGPKRSVVCYACSQDTQITAETEVSVLFERLDELDQQALSNFIETREIVSRLQELGKEVPNNKWQEGK